MLPMSDEQIVEVVKVIFSFLLEVRISSTNSGELYQNLKQFIPHSMLRSKDLCLLSEEKQSLSWNNFCFVSCVAMR